MMHGPVNIKFLDEYLYASHFKTFLAKLVAFEMDKESPAFSEAAALLSLQEV